MWKKRPGGRARNGGLFQRLTYMSKKIFSGRYQILEKVGSGGMAEVYRAFDTTLNRTVAVKVLHSQYAQEENFVTRFRQEAQAAANLNHPNIVNVYDWGAEGETYYIVMEYLVGRNLKEIIETQAPLPLSLIIDISRQVASALSFAHRRNIIHRDVKPHNIIITDDGEVKVTDFGIARSGTSTLTQTGSILGTAHYLSPEQAQGGEIGVASDLYSLGVVLYEMATGKVPFEGESPVAVALKQVHKAPLPPRQLNPDLPASLESVILRAMSKHPEDRYRSAEELREDLGRCAQGLPVQNVIPDGEKTVVIPRVAPVRTTPPEKKRSRVWLALVLLFLLISGVSAWAITYYLRVTTTVVPKIVGEREDKAREILQKKKLKFKIGKRVFSSKVAVGLVISQDPAPGGKVKVNSTVAANVSRGREKISLPKLVGKSLDQATFAIAKADLNIGDIRRQYSEEVKEDFVIEQDPIAGTRVPKGTFVNLLVSKGPRPLKVPDLTGKTAPEAAAILGQMNLSMTKTEEFDDGVESGRVIRQNPSPGTSIEQGETVNIVVSKGPELVKVPNVIDLTEAEAKTQLEGLGFVVQVNQGISPPSSYGKVVSQNPEPEKEARKGSTVIIWVGQKPTS